jgi:hypothetical protein
MCLPGLAGFAMVINGVPHFAHPRACGVHYLDTPSLIKYRRMKKITERKIDDNREFRQKLLRRSDE